MSTNQQIARKEQIDTVRTALERMKPQMALALPHHLTPDRLMRVAMTAIQNTPKLLECDRTSLYAAVITAAQLGLEPDGVLGQAYLVPFKGKVQFIPGYKGYLTLARNSGVISTIQAHEVCENDEFRYAYGIHEDLHHIPAEGERGEITHFYAYATFKDGGHVFEVMTRAQVDTIRNNSEGYKAFKAGHIKSTPWDSHYVQMGRKTAIRRIANYLPLSVQRAAALDGAYDAGKHARTDDYGDLVIDGEATDVTNETGANGATSKLDQLAGPGEAENDAKPPYTVEEAINLLESKRKLKTLEETGTLIYVAFQTAGLEVPEQIVKAYQAQRTKLRGSNEQPPTNGEGGTPEITQGGIMAALVRATTAEQVDEQLDLARSLPDDQRASIKQAAEARKKALAGEDPNLFGDES